LALEKVTKKKKETVGTDPVCFSSYFCFIFLQRKNYLGRSSGNIPTHKKKHDFKMLLK